MYYSQMEPWSSIYAIYITGLEHNSTSVNGKTYQQFPNDMSGITDCKFCMRIEYPRDF